MNYTVPGMKLIRQDKTMSCWYASAQMLIQWSWGKSQSCELAHPDPSMVKRWGKLYDDNPGIQNWQIQQFAQDLGLVMLPPMTPSPEYMKELLMRHGPLWINGKSHITVIAGIRSMGDGYQVLVFDPALPTLKHGRWHDFYEHYGLQAHTSLDASAGSETSMLRLDN